MMETHDTQNKPKPDEAISLKAKLLDLKIEECSGFDELIAYLDLSISDCPSSHGTQINKESVKAIDTILIWFSRAMQYLKHQKSMEYDFHELEGRLKHIFYLIDDLHHSSLGAFSNALTTLLKKLLQFAELTNCSDEFIIDIFERTQQRPATDKSYFVIIETILKLVTKSALVIKGHNENIEENCYKAMKHGALANSASKCVSLYYRRLKNPQEAPEEFMQLWTSKFESSLREEITRDKITAHLLPMLFRDIPDQFLMWIKTLDIKKSDPLWPKIMLPMLLVGLELSKSNGSYDGLLSESEIEGFLCDTDTKIRLSAFSFLASTVHASTPPPQFICNILGNYKLLDFIIQELQTPDDRTTFVFHLRNMLLKMKAYADKKSKVAKKDVDASIVEVQVLCTGYFNYVRSHLNPDSSYAQLSIATEVASFFITDEFDGIPRSPKLKDGAQLVHVFTKDFIRSLLRLNSNNYDDIRQRCSTMLSYCPYPDFTSVLGELPIENTLKLVDGSKKGVADSFADLFVTISQAHVKNRPDSYIQLLGEVMIHLESNCSNKGAIVGSMAVISSILSVATHSIVKLFHKDFEKVFTRLFVILDEQWSEFYSSQENPESQVGDKLDNWKNLRETSILIEALLNVNQLSSESLMLECTFFEICENLMDALSSVTHRGTFTSILLAFMRCCTICLSGKLRSLPKSWLQANLKLVATRKQLISRRSAGLPYLVSGILVAAAPQKGEIEEYMNLTFKELLAIATETHDDDLQSSVDLPQVNAFNCMTQIFKESALRDRYKKYLGAALNASLEKLNHPVWSIKNGALMLFTALQNSFFGSNKLEDVVPSMKEELFFSQFPETFDILLRHLQNSNIASPNEAIPILSIVGRLQPSSNKSNLKPFIDLIRTKYLGHGLWKIREIAAFLIANMTKTKEVNLELVPSLSTLKNETHGRLFCILELLRQETQEFPSSLKDSFQEQLQVCHFSKWFILELYVRIMDVCDLTSVDLSIVYDAFEKCLNETEGLNGSSKLFMKTSLRYLLYHARDMTERVAFSQKFMATEQKDAIHETALYWQQNLEEFRKVHILHRQIFDTMKNVTLGANVFKSLLKLTAKANLPLSETFDDSSWPDEWKCLNMTIQVASSSFNPVTFTEKFLEYSRDDQPENVRIEAVSAAKRLFENGAGANSDYAELKLLFHEKQSDDSPQVRKLAVHSPFDFHNHIKWSSSFIAEYQETAENLLLENLRNSIMLNLATSKEEFSNNLFDIARDNLYRSEVAVFTDYAAALFSQKNKKRENTLDEKLHDLCKCIEDVTVLVFENRSLVESWTYNSHIDTAIRKISALRVLSNSQKLRNSSKPLFEFLHASHYPLEQEAFS